MNYQKAYYGIKAVLRSHSARIVQMRQNWKRRYENMTKARDKWEEMYQRLALSNTEYADLLEQKHRLTMRLSLVEGNLSLAERQLQTLHNQHVQLQGIAERLRESLYTQKKYTTFWCAAFIGSGILAAVWCYYVLGM